MGIDDVDMPLEDESIDDEDADTEEIHALKVSPWAYLCPRPFSTERESVLGMWTPTLQARRHSSLTELFVLLYGLLFTNIQLDDFK